MLGSTKSKIRRLWKRLNSVSYAILGYLVISAVLSLFIFLRLDFSSSDLIKEANVGFYFLMYFGASFLAVSYCLTVAFNYNKKKPNYKRSLRFYLVYLGFVSAAIFFFVVPLSANGILAYDWVLLIFPVLLAYVAYVSVNPYALTKRRKQMIAVALIVSIFLPVASAFTSQQVVLWQLAGMPSPNQKVQVIGNLTRNNLGTYSGFRSGSDYWKYLIVGTGACFEGAMASATLLNAAGFNSRVVALPGEDHAFTEVQVNGTWMVIDPGYGDTAPVSRHQRADARLTEMGAISYVIAYSGSNFTELTSLYVPTDTITIKVTDGGKPTANAEVYLTHEFRNRTVRLPDTNLSFFTNATGEVTFHLGALTYNQNASQYENYYHIFVKGINTGYNVTSTGTNMTRLIVIDQQKGLL